MSTLYEENRFEKLSGSEFVDEFIEELEVDIKKEILDEFAELEEENNNIKHLEKESEKCNHSSRKNNPIGANCRSEIHIKPKNKIIYVCKGGAQYFLVESSKCCKEIHTEYLGSNFDKRYNKIYGNLGVYYILSSGILFVPKKDICSGEIDILSFKAFDDCNHYKFDVVFTFDPCKCCKK